MNLRDQLKDILPDILPGNPAESITGAELINLVRSRLDSEYSDATLRFHFSIMSCDPSSPIAMMEDGRGYFLRRKKMPRSDSEGKIADPDDSVFSRVVSSLCFERLSREEREGHAIETVIAAAPSPWLRFELIDTKIRGKISPNEKKRLEAGISAILDDTLEVDQTARKSLVAEENEFLGSVKKCFLDRRSPKQAQTFMRCPPSGNLRDQLRVVLPDILPRNPAQAIRGAELIEMVKHRLKQDYSDATLRYHFSIMSCDPSSPIAKVEQGQGYYLRTTTIQSLNCARNLFHSGEGLGENGVVLGNAELGLAIGRALKFRSVVQRYLESVCQFPFAFEESFSTKAGANRWRIPDLVVIDWLTSEGHAPRMDKHKLEVQRRMGVSPLRITGVTLRLVLDHATVLEDLYQCLSASEWANVGELIVATPIEDPRLVEEVSRFAARHGIGVISFGLSEDVLDDMPKPAVVENMTDREFESLLGHFLAIRRHAAPIAGRDHDWQHIVENAAVNNDFARFESWISLCLLEERIISAREYDELALNATRVESEFVA